jgi:hypothetical protein
MPLPVRVWPLGMVAVKIAPIHWDKYNEANLPSPEPAAGDSAQREIFGVPAIGLLFLHGRLAFLL